MNKETRNNIQERTTEVLSAGKCINMLGKSPYTNTKLPQLLYFLLHLSHKSTLNKQKYHGKAAHGMKVEKEKKYTKKVQDSEAQNNQVIIMIFMSKVRNLHLSWNRWNDYPKRKEKTTYNILDSTQIESSTKFILLSHVLRIINLLIFNSLFSCAKVTLLEEL